MLVPRPYRVRLEYRVHGVRRSLSFEAVPPAASVRAFEGRNDDVLVRASLSAVPHELVVDTRVTALRDHVELERIQPLCVALPADEPLRFLRQGWHGALPAGTVTYPPASAGRIKRHLRRAARSLAAFTTAHQGPTGSSLFTAVSHADRPEAAVLGFLDAADGIGHFRLRLEGGASRRNADPAQLVAWHDFGGVPLPEGEIRAAHPLLMSWGGDVTLLLEGYAEVLGRHMGARSSSASLVGWRPPPHRPRAFDEKMLDAALQHLGSSNEALGVTHVLVGPGYQAAVGDWLRTHPKFPSGLRALAGRIEQRGLTPALWIAPFLAQPDASIVDDHPEWFVRADETQHHKSLPRPAWRLLQRSRILDPTHPQALRWIERTFGTLVDWGFRCFHLDALYAGSLPGKRHDTGCTGMRALRIGLQAIRDAVGDSVRLEGAACPTGAGVGLLDAAQIAPSPWPIWGDGAGSVLKDEVFPAPTAANVVRSMLARSFLHGRLWRGQAPPLVTCWPDPWGDVETARLLATTAALTGDAFWLGDPLDTASLEHRQLVHQAVALARAVGDATTRHLDPFGNGLHMLHARPPQSRVAYLGVLNVTDRARRVTISADTDNTLSAHLGKARAVRELWTQRFHEAGPAGIDLGELPPHAARVLVLG